MAFGALRISKMKNCARNRGSATGFRDLAKLLGYNQSVGPG
jgi:hypothetical protein